MTNSSTDKTIACVKDVLRASRGVTDRLSESVITMQVFVDLISEEPDPRGWEPAFIALMEWHDRLRAVLHDALDTLAPLAAQARQDLRLMITDQRVDP